MVDYLKNKANQFIQDVGAKVLPVIKETRFLKEGVLTP